MSRYNKDFIQYSEEKVKDETKHLALYFATHIFLYIVLIFFLIFFAWYTVFITTHKFYEVKGVSMMPTLNSQITEEQLLYDTNNAQNLAYDAVYIDKITKPEIFDIIVVERQNSSSVIKRLMATEGDYITIAKGKTQSGEDRFYFYRIPSGVDPENYSDEQAKLQENGENGYNLYNSDTLWIHKSASSIKTVESGNWEYEYNFYQTFLRQFENSEAGYFVSENGLLYVQVPQDMVFYMGDNREYSSDCRENGFCREDYIVGRAEFIVYDYNFVNRLWEVVKFYFREMEEFFAR